MVEYLKNITIYEALAWSIIAIGFLAVLIKNWQTIKPAFSKISNCAKRNKTNQLMLQDHEERLVEIQTDVKNINSNLIELETNSREYRKTSLSDKIFKKYQQYILLGSITRDELENFNICIERYKKCLLENEVENDIVLNKYLAEVMKLDVV